MINILDLFCGAGGASRGYELAAIALRIEVEITGIDIYPQPRYPYSFIEQDALDLTKKDIINYHFIHASPPCQKFSRITPSNNKRKHINYIPRIRRLIKNKPYIIENVPEAKRYLRKPIMLCGTMFNLKVYRHRYFESSFNIEDLKHYPHYDSMPSANRPGGLETNLSPKGFISVVGGGTRKHPSGRKDIYEYRKKAMGINWMNRYELAQSIPPAYTKFIGEQLFKKIIDQN